MGPGTWGKRRGYYEGLTLSEDGDSLERLASTEFSFNSEFPNYERFWKLNIAPSSLRPLNPIGFRQGVCKPLKFLSQSSYSTLHNLVQAKRFADLITKENYGFHNANIQCVALFAGNAIQLLEQVRNTVEQKIGGILSSGPLTAIPEWRPGWKARRTEILKYRNYLTHQGLPITVVERSNGTEIPYVLKRDVLRGGDKDWTAWSYDAIADDHTEQDFVPYVEATLGMLNETIAFCNDVYGRLADCLEPYHQTVEFQEACGWAIDLPAVP